MQVSRADLGDLRAFLTVAKHRSFKQAGVELGVTNAALSMSLKTFERRLGVRLLNREGGHVFGLTAAGQHLVRSLELPVSKIISVLESFDPVAFGME
jgi:DNA-binding transcriptional LysR family regulator